VSPVATPLVVVLCWSAIVSLRPVRVLLRDGPHASWPCSWAVCPLHASRGRLCFLWARLYAQEQ
jgi:hypothetical protein